MKNVLLFVFAALILNGHDMDAKIKSTGATGKVNSYSAKTISKDDLEKIHGKIQFVTSFADYKVQVVTSFADLDVQKVNSFADSPGKWEIVTSSPDYKIQIVKSFPDFKIRYVNSFPGVK